jgi:hypothetical protein
MEQRGVKKSVHSFFFFTRWLTTNKTMKVLSMVETTIGIHCFEIRSHWDINPTPRGIKRIIILLMKKVAASLIVSVFIIFIWRNTSSKSIPMILPGILICRINTINSPIKYRSKIIPS